MLFFAMLHVLCMFSAAHVIRCLSGVHLPEIPIIREVGKVMHKWLENVIKMFPNRLIFSYSDGRRTVSVSDMWHANNAGKKTQIAAVTQRVWQHF